MRLVLRNCAAIVAAWRGLRPRRRASGVSKIESRLKRRSSASVLSPDRYHTAVCRSRSARPRPPEGRGLPEEIRGARGVWKTPVTQPMLERELQRIVRGSRCPIASRTVRRARGRSGAHSRGDHAACPGGPPVAQLLRWRHRDSRRIPSQSSRGRDSLLRGGRRSRRLARFAKSRRCSRSGRQGVDRPRRRQRLTAVEDAGAVYGFAWVETRADGSARSLGTESRSRRSNRGGRTRARDRNPGCAAVRRGSREFFDGARKSSRCARGGSHRERRGRRGWWPRLPCGPDDFWDNGALDDVPRIPGSVRRPSGPATSWWCGARGAAGLVGLLSSIALGTGGRYDPATDSWTPTSQSGAPSARYGHTACGPGAP